MNKYEKVRNAVRKGETPDHEDHLAIWAVLIEMTEALREIARRLPDPKSSRKSSH